MHQTNPICDSIVKCEWHCRMPWQHRTISKSDAENTQQNKTYYSLGGRKSYRPELRFDGRMAALSFSANQNGSFEPVAATAVSELMLTDMLNGMYDAFSIAGIAVGGGEGSLEFCKVVDVRESKNKAVRHSSFINLKLDAIVRRSLHEENKCTP